MFVNGVLLIYYHPLSNNAPTIMDHVKSFGRYSEFKVWEVNTIYGFPAGIKEIQFSLIVLHYSLFGDYPFQLSEKYLNYIGYCKRSAKVAFFQDEYIHCGQRYSIINRLQIDIIYTLLEEKYFDLVYRDRTNVKYIQQTLAGYVPDRLISQISQFARPITEREIDVGYRARQLPYFMGRGGQEKTDISIGFLRHASKKKFRTDVSNDECKRIYGDNWFQFIGNCKFMLGVEAGVSIFDFDGSIEKRCRLFLAKNPEASFNDFFDSFLINVDGNVDYRMISPRIFESAALQTVPLLFSGSYNGIIKPDINYIEIEKDFSNINLVFEKMDNELLIQKIIKNNLLLISKYELTYHGFIASFDEDVKSKLGVMSSDLSNAEKSKVETLINRGFAFRRLIVFLKYNNFPGRNILKFLHKNLLIVLSSVKKSMHDFRF